MFHLEIVYLKSIFLKNSYPIHFIDKCIMIFMSKVFKEKRLNYDVQKKVITIILPYLGKLSSEIRLRLTKIVSRNIPACNLRLITRSSRRLRNVFRFKDVLPTTLCSYIVYGFQCKSCNALYYGKSDRHFHHRACEHLGISHLTGKKYKTPKMSAISDHMLQTGHSADTSDFRIISKEPSRSSFKLLLRESLLIYRDHPSLNKTSQSYPLALFNE